MSLLTKTVSNVIAYEKFRPTPPRALIKTIVGFLNERVSYSKFFVFFFFNTLFYFVF